MSKPILGDWFARSRKICSLTDAQRKAFEEALGGSLSRQRLCTFRKIARLHPRLGQLCDECRAPLALVARIAHAKGAAAQRERAKTLLSELLAKRAARGEPTKLETALLEAVGKEEG